jgi:antitoxin (DNA-binding transcriptional repressor) of toxin-antitoxin stability system
MSKQISASDAKNNFGVLLDDVATLGRVDIVKHGRLVAIMLSPRAFSGLAGDTRADEDSRWGAKHMIPPGSARGARIVGLASTFDED